MALIPRTRYPAQTDVEADSYPYGRARNAGSYQDGSGTPLHADWVNDLWGSQQALLDAAAITPNGTPDQVGASQYLDALVSLTSLKIAVYTVSAPGGVAVDAPFTLTPAFVRGGYTVVSGTVVMPGPGKYLAMLTGTFHASSTTNPTEIIVGARSTGGAGTFFAASSATRRSAVAADTVTLSFMRVGTVTDDPDPEDGSVQDLKIVPSSGGTSPGLVAGNGTLLVLAL